MHSLLLFLRSGRLNDAPHRLRAVFSPFNPMIESKWKPRPYTSVADSSTRRTLNSTTPFEVVKTELFESYLSNAPGVGPIGPVSADYLEKPRENVIGTIEIYSHVYTYIFGPLVTLSR